MVRRFDRWQAALVRTVLLPVALSVPGMAIADVERGREVTRRFLGTGTAYTPQSVNFYGN